MTPSAALLPHERHCPECGGEGEIECAASKHPGEENTWREPCRECDSTGVVADERRDNEAGRWAVDQLTGIIREKVLAVLREQDRIHSALIDQRDRYAKRCDDLARVVDHQARLLAVAKPDPRKLEEQARGH